MATYRAEGLEETSLAQVGRSKVSRRSALEAKMDVLRAVSEGITKPTQIMYEANLSWIVLQKYLKEIQESGLILEREYGARKQYEITTPGIALMQRYSSILTAIRI